MIIDAGMRRQLESRANVEPYRGPEDYAASFWETFSAAFAFTRREELSDSAGRAWGAAQTARNDAITQAGGDAQRLQPYMDIPGSWQQQLNDAYDRGDVESHYLWMTIDQPVRDSFLYLRQQAAQNPGVVLTDAQLREKLTADMAQQRELDLMTMARGGGLANFLGGAGALFTDPLLLMTLPLGGLAGGAARGASLWRVMSRAAAIEGALGLAIEVPIQAAVYDFKRQIESPWSWQNSAMNILGAGLGGAVIGGGIAGAQRGVQRALESWRAGREAGTARVTPDTEDAVRALEQTAALQRQNPLQGAAADATHEQAFEAARAQTQAGRGVDVSHLVDGNEALEPTVAAAQRVGAPGQVVAVDPLALRIDAALYQFKSGGDEFGVLDTLRDVRRFDPMLADVILVLERTDGTLDLVDGHQRVGLARRSLAAGQPADEVRLNAFVLREADGITPQAARRIAALKNMAAGTGTALDAARVLRELGTLKDLALPPLPPRSALVRQARGLAALSDESFMQVVNDVLPQNLGAMVGAATDDAALQQAMIQVLRRVRPANETQAAAIIEQVKAVGTETRVTEDLFGEQQITESLYLERAQVVDAVLREVRADRATFGRLIDQAERVEEAGNVLDRAANDLRLQEARSAQAQIIKLANTHGPISDALSAAARSVRAGTKPADAAAAVLDAVRQAISGGGNRAGATARILGPGGTPADAPDLNPALGRPVRLPDLPDDARGAATEQFLGRNGQDLDAHYAVAEANQQALATSLDEITAGMGPGVTVKNLGIKKRATSAGKLERKGPAYGPAKMTDIVRAGVVSRGYERVQEIIAALSARFDLLDEGMKATDHGYIDHKVLVRFPDGQVGEVQFWGVEMLRAKSERGHQLYEQMRGMPDKTSAEYLQLEAASRQLYANALGLEADTWYRAGMMLLPDGQRTIAQAARDSAGIGSAPTAPNNARNLASDSTNAAVWDSSAESTGIQSPARQTKPDGAPLASRRSTAGSQSQLRKVKDIDSAPRSVVREAPDASITSTTRTGTVSDEDYLAVMNQYRTLELDEGALLTVAEEVSGATVTRPARNVIEELDRLETNLERIRVCATVGDT